MTPTRQGMKNVFKSITEYIHNRRDIINAGLLAKRRKEIRNRFNIEENDGGVYIMCGDTAVWRLDDETTVSEILTKLTVCRLAALTHNQLLYHP